MYCYWIELPIMFTNIHAHCFQLFLIIIGSFDFSLFRQVVFNVVYSRFVVCVKGFKVIHVIQSNLRSKPPLISNSLSIATTLSVSQLLIYSINDPAVKNHLWTKTIPLCSHEWSLYTGSTLLWKNTTFQPLYISLSLSIITTILQQTTLNIFCSKNGKSL